MAFVPSSQLQNNHIVTAELFHSMKRKQGASGWVAVKGHMENAYDGIEWSFLEAILGNYAFSPHWTKLVMQCVSSAHFSLLLNESPFRHFSASRGLRQRDPLSPFLFILVADILSQLLSQVEASSCLLGMKLNSAAPSISHLFLTNDILLFGKATVSEVSFFKECLDKYALWSA